ncbi:MAG: hypothetical protein ABSD67_03120 [Terracidiphilus sp.]|jgi:hypothetical protein
MKARFAFVLLAVCVIAECVAAFGETLYPVVGPMATQAPPPAITAKFSGANSGRFTLTQAGGESFEGKWAFLVPSFVNAKTPETSSSYLPQPNLAFAWDTVYGQGYFLARVVGTRIRQAVATGNQGTVLQIECLYSDPHSGFNGVAVDSKGNIYKVVW